MSEDHDETLHLGPHHAIFNLGLTVCVYMSHSWEYVLGLYKVLMFGNLCTCIMLG